MAATESIMSTANINSKASVGVCVVGQSNSGKTTIVSRLLSELKSECTNVAADCCNDEASSPTSFYTKHEIATQSYYYTIFDTAGKSAHISNTLCAVSQCDVAVLVMPATQDDFEIAYSKNNNVLVDGNDFEGQSRQHLRLCHIYGIEQVIVLFNKMDDKTVNYSEKRFNGIEHKTRMMLTKLGYHPKKAAYIPISAINGDNINLDRGNNNNNMKWYKGFELRIRKHKIKGKTLMDALRMIVQPMRQTKIKNIIAKPFRMAVCNVNVCNIVNMSYMTHNLQTDCETCFIVNGRVAHGKAEIDCNVIFYPSNVKGKIQSIKVGNKMRNICSATDIVQLKIKTNDPKAKINIGNVMCIDDLSIDPNPPKLCKKFKVIAYVQDCANNNGKFECSKFDESIQTLKKDRMILIVGYCRLCYSKKWIYFGDIATIIDKYYFNCRLPLLHVRSAKAYCPIEKIDWKMGKSTNNKKVETPDYIQKNDQAVVTFVPQSPIVVLPFDECQPFGRCVFIDSQTKQVVMLAKCTSVNNST